MGKETMGLRKCPSKMAPRWSPRKRMAPRRLTHRWRLVVNPSARHNCCPNSGTMLPELKLEDSIAKANSVNMLPEFHVIPATCCRN